MINVEMFLRQLSSTQSENQAQIQQAMNYFQEQSQVEGYHEVLIDVIRSNHALEMRISAALLLKNWIKKNAALSLPLYNMLFDVACSLFIDDNATLRNISAIIISELFKVLILREERKVFYDSVKALTGMLNSDGIMFFSVLHCLSLICEDHTYTMAEAGEFCTSTFLLPVLIELWLSPNEEIRFSSLSSVFNFFFLIPTHMNENSDHYIQGLLHLSKDDSKRIRKKVMESFCVIADIEIKHLLNFFDIIVEFVLTATENEDPKIAQDSCEFWQVISKYEYVCHQFLIKYLERLIGALLNRMIFTDIVLQEMNLSNHDIDTPEDPSQIDYYYQEFDEMFSSSDYQWNVRKRAGEALDYLCESFESTILPYIFPFLEKGLTDPNWRVREATVLTIGIISSIDDMSDHLAQLVPFLLEMINDEEPLIRAVTCWTLSKYCSWIYFHSNLFNAFFQSLLNRMQDNVRRVRTSSCASIGIVCKVLDHHILNYSDILIEAFEYGLQNYSISSLKRLYDAISAFAISTGKDEFSKPRYKNIVEYLIQFWITNITLDSDYTDIGPIFDLIGSVALVLRENFIVYAVNIYNKCIFFIEEGVKALSFDDTNFDIEFLICSLELISSLIEAISASASQLIGQSNLVEYLTELIKYDISDLSQVVYAVIGDLTRNCYVYIEPKVNYFMDIMIRSGLSNHYKTDTFNNSCWAIGELVLQMGENIQPYLEGILKQFLHVLIYDTSEDSIMRNITVCIFRISINYSPVMHFLLEQMELLFLHLETVTQAYEFETAMSGLVQICNQYPEEMVKYFGYLCKIISSLPQTTNKVLLNDLRDLLLNYKEYFGNQWASVWDKLDPELRTKLSDQFSL